jgi:hypothetical protein
VTAKAWTAGGNAQIDTAQFLFGGASGLFDGNGDFLQTSTDTDWDFGTGDFTLEIAARRAGAGTGDRFLIERGNGADFLLRWNASGNLQFFINSTLVVTHPFTFAIGTWYRIAVSRVSGTVYLFINGVLEDSGLNSGNISSTNPVRLAGYQPANSDFFNGHLDEFRATKGVGRYTANYTVDSEEFLDF